MHKLLYIKGNPTQKRFYKIYANKLTKLKELAEKNYFHEQLQINKDNSKKTWDILRALLPNKVKPPLPKTIKINDNVLTEPHDIAREMNTYFVNVGKQLSQQCHPPDDHKFQSYLRNSPAASIYLSPTNHVQIVSLINPLKLNKAPGHDDIPPYFLKLASNIITYPLSIIFNFCLSLGIFPQRLKTAKVIPIYKCGPADALGNYRPIFFSLHSQVFEKLLLKRVTSFLEENNILTLTQYEFHKTYSTIHPILDIVTESYDSMNDKKYSSLIFLDIKKAFDSVCHEKLL